MSTNSDATTIDIITGQDDFNLGYSIAAIAGMLAGKVKANADRAKQYARNTLSKVSTTYNNFANHDFMADVRERDYALELARNQDDQYERFRFNPATDRYELV